MIFRLTQINSLATRGCGHAEIDHSSGPGHGCGEEYCQDMYDSPPYSKCGPSFITQYSYPFSRGTEGGLVAAGLDVPRFLRAAKPTRGGRHDFYKKVIGLALKMHCRSLALCLSTTQDAEVLRRSI